nr:MAG TPA: hypothetical protein [Caudoviricetes sp.]DAQ59671.1 MAG TPA: hypothetical protein [Caudoviricetes sp.]DAW15846.1 MAG TPA: hypothetical protein [Caudoviricetes sp.]
MLTLFACSCTALSDLEKPCLFSTRFKPISPTVVLSNMFHILSA